MPGAFAAMAKKCGSDNPVVLGGEGRGPRPRRIGHDQVGGLPQRIHQALGRLAIGVARRRRPAVIKVAMAAVPQYG